MHGIVHAQAHGIDHAQAHGNATRKRMALPRARAWTIYRAGILLANMPPGLGLFTSGRRARTEVVPCMLLLWPNYLKGWLGRDLDFSW